MFKKLTHIISIAAVLSTAAMLLSLQSCHEDDGPHGPDIGERDSLPVLVSRGVSQLISDSGIIRYKIISEDWYIYDKTPVTYWAFEKGMFLEQFDESFHVEAFISCDTAYYYDTKRLWELRGRVFLKNLKGEKFRTSLLYWDQSTHQIYSDRYMEIEGEQQLSGYDFRSNEQLTVYRIHNSKGAFPFSEDNETPTPEASMEEQHSDDL